MDDADFYDGIWHCHPAFISACRQRQQFLSAFGTSGNGSWNCTGQFFYSFFGGKSFTDYFSCSPCRDGNADSGEQGCDCFVLAIIILSFGINFIKENFGKHTGFGKGNYMKMSLRFITSLDNATKYPVFQTLDIIMSNVPEALCPCKQKNGLHRSVFRENGLHEINA